MNFDLHFEAATKAFSDRGSHRAATAQSPVRSSAISSRMNHGKVRLPIRFMPGEKVPPINLSNAV
jgi:hypothetical protein